MGYPTPIEWTDATWNPIGGCSIKSPDCSPWYAQKLAGTRLKNHPLYAGTTNTVRGKPVFNGHLMVSPDDHPYGRIDPPARVRIAVPEDGRSLLGTAKQDGESGLPRYGARSVVFFCVCQGVLNFRNGGPNRVIIHGVRKKAVSQDRQRTFECREHLSIDIAQGGVLVL
jgi:Protein of unknown function (DUF5131)